MRSMALTLVLVSSFMFLACAAGPGAGGGAAGAGGGGQGGARPSDAASDTTVNDGSAGSASAGAGGSAGGGAGSGVAGTAGSAGCKVDWTTNQFVVADTHSSTVADGVLLLTSSLDSDQNVEFSHDGNYADGGDLDFSLDFEAFSPAGGDVFLLLEAKIVNYGAGDYALPFAGMISEAGVTYVTAGVDEEYGPSMGEHHTPTTSMKGTARIQKQGTTFTMTATAVSGETATFTADLPAEETEISFFFGPAPNQTKGATPASVRVTTFRLTDSNGAYDDDTFDCFSARPI